MQALQRAHMRTVLEEERRQKELERQLQLQRNRKQTQRVEYGELDRPAPEEVIADIKDKFVDWDCYKMNVMLDLLRRKQAKAAAAANR